LVHSDTKKSVKDSPDMPTDVDLVASRLRSHFSSLSSNFEDMAPEAVTEIARHLVEYRDRRLRSANS
jgi:hypothetical protein